MKKHVLLTTIALLVVCLLVGCGAPAGVTPSEPRPASQAAQAQGKTDDAAAAQNAATPAADTSADTAADADDAVESAPATEPAKAAQTPAPAASQTAAQTTAAPKQTAAAKQATTKADADDPEGCAPENMDDRYKSLEDFAENGLPKFELSEMTLLVPRAYYKSKYFSIDYLAADLVDSEIQYVYVFNAVLAEEKTDQTDTAVSITAEEQSVEDMYSIMLKDEKNTYRTVGCEGITFEIFQKHLVPPCNRTGTTIRKEYDMTFVFWTHNDHKFKACIYNHTAYIDDILPELIMEPVTVTAPAQ